jgi:CRISPR/Cas system-associated protein Cas10 (large subunit of type III CRISPR-Cas system)
MLLILLGVFTFLAASILFVLIKKASGVRAILRSTQEAKSILEKAKEDAEKRTSRPNSKGRLETRTES